MRERRDKSRPRHGLVDVTVKVPAEKAGAVRRFAGRVALRREPARRDDIIEKLRSHRHVTDRFGVDGILLFGSVGRDEARGDSDIDLIVEFARARPKGLFEFVELKNALEGLLGRPVDLITPTTIKPRLKARILGEAVRVF